MLIWYCGQDYVTGGKLVVYIWEECIDYLLNNCGDKFTLICCMYYAFMNFESIFSKTWWTVGWVSDTNPIELIAKKCFSQFQSWKYISRITTNVLRLEINPELFNLSPCIAYPFIPIPLSISLYPYPFIPLPLFLYLKEQTELSVNKLINKYVSLWNSTILSCLRS